MKLSVIVPVYNAEKYLRACLDSLTAQTVDDYEIIVIDDGSTDASAVMIAEYAAAHPGLFVTRRVENGGQGRARNIGMGMARGEYIGFVDSDDWVEPAMFRTLCSAADGQGADLVLCDRLRAYPDGSEQPDDTSTFSHRLEISACVWNKLFKNTLLQSIRFPEGIWYEDLPFVVEAVLSAEKIVSVHQALYHYRCGQPSTTNNNNARRNLDVITAAEETQRFMHAGGLDEGFRYVLINHVLIDSLARLGAQPESPEKRRVIREIRDYVRSYIPDLTACESFKKESLNRRIAMYLNYHGMDRLSGFLVDMKKRLRG